MSAALKTITPPQPTGSAQTYAPRSAANDNCYLSLVDECPPGVKLHHSRSPALFPPDRRRRPHGTKTEGSRALVMAYDSRNRLSSHTDTGGPLRVLGYDARGNVTGITGQSFLYDAADQPVQISGFASGFYTYDGNLKRVKSVVDGKTIYNIFDASGTLVHIDKVTDGKKTDYIGKFVRQRQGGTPRHRTRILA